MYGAEITLLGIGLTLLLVGILSASFACCAVCRCCGAIDSAAVVPIDPKVTVVTTSNGYNFQQVAQPVSYVNGQPIDNKYGQQPFAQQPFVQQPFAQQPFAQQPIVPPTYDQFNQSQQSLKSSMTNVPATLDSFAPVVVA